MAIEAAKSTPYPLTWSYQDQRFQTTIEPICRKDTKHPSLSLNEGVLCLAKNRRYRVKPVDPETFKNFKSIKIDGISFDAKISDGATEFKIPKKLNFSLSSKKQFEISINETCFASDPFFLFDIRRKFQGLKRIFVSKTVQPSKISRTIEAGTRSNPNFRKRVLKFHQYDKPSHLLQVVNDIPSSSEQPIKLQVTPDPNFKFHQFHQYDKHSRVLQVVDDISSSSEQPMDLQETIENGMKPNPNFGLAVEYPQCDETEKSFALQDDDYLSKIVDQIFFPPVVIDANGATFLA